MKQEGSGSGSGLNKEKQVRNEEARKELARSFGRSEDATQEELLEAVEEEVLRNTETDSEFSELMHSLVAEEEKEKWRVFTGGEKKIKDSYGKSEEEEGGGEKREAKETPAFDPAEISMFEAYQHDPTTGETRARFVDEVTGRSFFLTQKQCEERMRSIARFLTNRNTPEDVKEQYREKDRKIKKIIDEWR